MPNSDRAGLLVTSFAALVLAACANTTPSSPITPSPVATNSPTTAPTPSTPTEWDVVVTSSIDDRPANKVRVRVIDDAHRLTGVQAPTPDQLDRNLGALFTNQIALVSLDTEGRTILILWAGFACDESATLTIGAADDSVTVNPDPIGTCDLIRSYRGVVVTFAAAPLRLDLRTTPIVEPT